jgi:hypothetical protein
MTRNNSPASSRGWDFPAQALVALGIASLAIGIVLCTPDIAHAEIGVTFCTDTLPCVTDPTIMGCADPNVGGTAGLTCNTGCTCTTTNRKCRCVK